MGNYLDIGNPNPSKKERFTDKPKGDKERGGEDGFRGGRRRIGWRWSWGW